MPHSTLLASDALNARVADEGWVAIPEGSTGSELPFADPGSPDAVVVRRPDGQLFLVQGEESIPLDGRWRSVWTEEGQGRWYRTNRHADGTLVVVRSGMWRTRFVGQVADVERARASEGYFGPFLGDGMGALYRSGVFGKRIGDGGTGEAEDILLDAAEIVIRTMWGPFENAPLGELAVYYAPVADDIGHELVGLLDAQDPDIQSVAWDVIRRAYRLLDDGLAHIIERNSPDVVIISADHGMAPIRHTFLPNVVLRDAGFARSDAAGEADPNASDVWYHVAGTGLLLANHRGLSGGWLDEAEARTALGAAMRILLGAVDERGVPAVHSFADAHGNSVSPADPPRDEVYVVFRSDVLPRADLPEASSAWGAPLRSGAHVTNDGDPRLRATYTVSTIGRHERSMEHHIENTDIVGIVYEYLREEAAWSGSL
ncbi:alkaline phosphatase family protein [Paenarthrobacter sp. NPDC056912]|uniref:alkaline phosphatase family protein n=1 Tax=Paenarthrobacter sp. NPDC056912 TaxID=3345965 RepID=UPI00366C16B2